MTTKYPLASLVMYWGSHNKIKSVHLIWPTIIKLYEYMCRKKNGGTSPKYE